MVIPQEGNSLKELEALQKIVPFAPLATSYGMGWKGLQAVRYRDSSGRELSVAHTPGTHVLTLLVRPPEKMDLRYEGGKRDMPPPAGSIMVAPAWSSVLWRRQGSIDVLHVLLEPSVVAGVGAESFELDPTRAVVPPLDGLNVPELRSWMLAVDAELRAGNVGGPLVVESLANVLAVHLIRHTTGAHRLPASADGVLPRRKLRTVIEYIMENLEGCGETVSSAWRRSRSAPASRTKAIFPLTSSGSSASRRVSFGFPQEKRKSPQALARTRTPSLLACSSSRTRINLIVLLSKN